MRMSFETRLNPGCNRDQTPRTPASSTAAGVFAFALSYRGLAHCVAAVVVDLALRAADDADVLTCRVVHWPEVLCAGHNGASGDVECGGLHGIAALQ